MGRPIEQPLYNKQREATKKRVIRRIDELEVELYQGNPKVDDEWLSKHSELNCLKHKLERMRRQRNLKDAGIQPVHIDVENYKNR